jgi:hypothetical protein
MMLICPPIYEIHFDYKKNMRGFQNNNDDTLIFVQIKGICNILILYFSTQPNQRSMKEMKP